MSSTSASLTTAFAPAGRLARARDAVLAIGRAAAALARAVRHRREVTHLLELDARQLKDIGLVRNDVVGALSLPFANDPSVHLRLDAVARRARARARSVPADARIVERSLG